MPYPNFHAAQMKPAGKKYVRTRYMKITSGVFSIVGVLPAAKKGVKGGKTEIQSYRFDRKKFTAAGARKWLKDHKIKPSKFEKATGKNETLINMEEFRMLFEVALNEQGCPGGGGGGKGKKKKKKRKRAKYASAAARR